MNINYKGYILEIEEVEVSETGKTRLVGDCKAIGYIVNTLKDYNCVIETYKRDIDKLLEKKEIPMTTNSTITQDTPKQIERDILKKTRGVFKYQTSCYFKDHTSSKNELVQVGYLDLDDDIVFNEPDEEYVSTPDKLVRYLPGFMVKGYRSCEEYIPKSPKTKESVEIREVLSENTIQYTPSTYGSSPRVTYSVIGYLGDNEELIYYNEIVDKA